MVAEGYVEGGKKQGIRLMNFVLSNPKVYRFMGKMGRSLLRIAPFLVNNGLNPWYKNREMPVAPAESFRDWYLKNEKNG